MKRSRTIDEPADERFMKGWHEGVVRGRIGDEQMMKLGCVGEGRCALVYICTFMCPSVGEMRSGVYLYFYVPGCVFGCALVLGRGALYLYVLEMSWR